MKITPFLFSFMLISGSLLFTGCKESGAQQDTSAPKEEQNVQSNKGQAFIEDETGKPNALRIAINSEDHSTLVTAVQTAELENALVNVGPLTVFAPTNAAFDKLPEGTLNDLLKPENRNKLAFILKNHVAPSNYPIGTLKKNVRKGRTLFMASGENIEVTQVGDDIFVGGAKIIGTVDASNGWVHIIEDVIIPEN